MDSNHASPWLNDSNNETSSKRKHVRKLETHSLDTSQPFEDGSYPDEITVLICSANLGNSEPTESSIAAMIPENGYMPVSPSNNSTGKRQSKRFDIIAVGLQEATFTSPNKSLLTAESVLTPMMTVTASTDHVNKNTIASHVFKQFNIDDPSELYGGTRHLHERIMSRLGKGYTCCLHYQRGGMRLMIMTNHEIFKEIRENGGIFVNGENTGIGSILPNKGGIFAAFTLRKTRFCFLTAHLNAHEGDRHYNRRCSNITEILNCAKIGPTPESRMYDVSLSSHYCFIFGDLNFRLKLKSNAPYEDKVDEVIQMIEQEQWHHLHEIDELVNGINNNELLAGFETLKCCFPPTYKVMKGFDWFRYDGQRIPSYTDRVLWKCADGHEANLSPLFYEPCPLFHTSDHKPICSGFSIIPKESKLKYKSLSECATSETSTILLNTQSEKEYSMALEISSISCNGLKVYDNNNGYFQRTCNPYVMFVTDPANASRGKNRFVQTLDNLRKNEIIEKLQESKIADGMRQFATITKNRLTEERKQTKQGFVRHGNPRTRRIRDEKNPNWTGVGDQIIIEVKSRSPSIDSFHTDLCGSFLYISAMHYDARRGDSLIGTVALDMQRFVPDSSLEQIYDNSWCWIDDSSSTFNEELERDSICYRSKNIEINKPLLRNGKICGRLSCSIVALCYCYEKEQKTDSRENIFKRSCICCT